MENKTPSQNIQDVYLNTVRRDKAPVTIFLISGVKLIGKIKGFDKYSVILEANNQEQLIFKHAISTVTTARMAPPAPPLPPPLPQAATTERS
jgi:host factor-I protein